MSQLVGSLGRVAVDVFRCADVKSRYTGGSLEVEAAGVGMVTGPVGAGFYPGSLGLGLTLGYTGMILMTTTTGADPKSGSPEPEFVEPTLRLG